MSHTLTALRYLPDAYWPLDQNTPFTDRTGNGRTGTSTSASANHIGLVHGAGAANLFSNANPGVFQSTVYGPGQEKVPFSISAWVKPVIVGATAPQKIVSKTSAYDGIYIEGNYLYFGVTFANTGQLRASYYMDEIKKVHVVGVYNINGIALFVNGELVDEKTLSTEQSNDVFSAAASFTSGTSTSSNLIAVNGVGIYSRALTGSQILDIYNAGIVDDINSRGQEINLTLDQSRVSSISAWEFQEDWSRGVLTNVSLEADYLIPTVISGVLQAGYWKNSFPIDPNGNTSTYAVVPYIRGEYVRVEVSLDGVTWEDAVTGKGLTLIPSGFNPDSKILEIRVSFSNVEGYLEYLEFQTVSTGVNTYADGRTVTIVRPAEPNFDREEFELNDLWGIRSNIGGSIKISNPSAVRSAEVWFKVNDGANDIILLDGRVVGSTSGVPIVTLAYQTGTTSSANATRYINGVAQSGSTPNPQIGAWHVAHIVFSADTTNTITIAERYNGGNSGNIQIGKVVLFNTALTAGEVSDIYNGYTGQSVFTAADVGAVSVTENATASNIYAHDWTIITAG